MTVARLARVLVLAAALTLTGGAVALADTDTSTNWAGWAVHGGGTGFRSIQALWVEPAARCTAKTPTYSAVWVGLGGYAPTSPALEQIGTEVDCTAGRKPVQSVWYEMVPAASQAVGVTVRAGDVIGAAVSVTGHRVRLALEDFTRGKKFDRTFTSRLVDVSAAEWIVEAPTQCETATNCTDLPLAPFSPVHFSGATVTTTTGHVGAISDASWTSTQISLFPDVQPVGKLNPPGGANASPLSADGSAFSVTFTRDPALTNIFHTAIRHLR